MNYKACIFDLDGTLINSITSISTCCNKAMEAFGYKGNPAQNYRNYAGDGAKVMLKRSLFDSIGKELDDNTFLKVFAKYEEFFAEGCLLGLEAYDGLVESLAKLKAMKLKLAVLSNKQHVNTVKCIEKVYGKNTFDIIRGQVPGVALKPDPEAALLIASELKIPTNSIIYVGDTRTDVKTGKAANMFTVAVKWGFRGVEEFTEADAIIEKPEDLLKIACNRIA